MIRFAPLLLLALAACDKPTAENAAAPANVAADAGVDYLAKIAALPEGQQRLVLYRAIRDAQQECQNIVSIAKQPDVEGRAAWNVVCRGGLLYAVTIGRNGMANVTGPYAADKPVKPAAPDR